MLLLPTAHCSLTAPLLTVSLHLIVPASPVARALFAAALLISAYALLRYWRSLGGRSSMVRFPLVTLRAVTLLLMTCALAGLEVEYETGAKARVLLSDKSIASSGVETRATATGSVDRVEAEMVASLKAKGLDAVVSEDEVADRSHGNEGFVAAVLLTDGTMGAGDARRWVERINARAGGAPTFVVADSDRSETAGVALEGVIVLGRARAGVPLMVRCDLHARGLKGHESLVTISDDAKVQSSASVPWTADDERQSVTLTVIPKVAGWVDYSAKVEAAGSPDVARLTRPFSLYVEEGRSRILFFESEPTWEAKFIRRALEQTGLFDVDYFAQVSRAATVGVSEEAKEQGADAAQKTESAAAVGSPEAKLHAALQSAARLNLYDCVIVGATDNSLLSSAEVARLSDWVERRGGGLVILGGNSFSGSIASPGGKLYRLLPAETSASQFQSQAEVVSQGHPLEAEKARGSFAIVPTQDGASGALYGYLNASEGAKTFALTGQGFRLGALRPGASALAVAGQPGASGTSEEGAALVAAMRYGAGRALVFGPADSWRIRATGANDEEGAGGAFNALWQGIVLWASAGARPHIEIALSDESPEEGEAVTAELRARDASFSPLKISKLSARWQPLTEEKSADSSAQAEEIAFAPDATDQSIWRARFRPHARGRFALDVDYTAAGGSGSAEKYFTVVASRENEPGAAFDTLRRVARSTGGDLITPAEINDLSQRLAADSTVRETVRRTWQLRTWWPLAFIIPLLLSAEWFARRWWKVD